MTDFNATRALEIIREHITTVADFKTPASGLGSRLGAEFPPRSGAQSISPVMESLVVDIAKAFDYLHSTRIAAYDTLAADAAAALHHIRDQIVSVRHVGVVAPPARFAPSNDTLRAAFLETQSFVRENIPMSDENSVDVAAVLVDRIARGVAEGIDGPFIHLAVDIEQGVRIKPVSKELGAALARLAAALDSRLAGPPVVDLRPFLVRLHETARRIAENASPTVEPEPFTGSEGLGASPEARAVVRDLDDMIRRLRAPYGLPATPLETVVAEWANAERLHAELTSPHEIPVFSPAAATVVRTAVAELADRRALELTRTLERMGVSRQMLRNLADVEG